MLDSAWRMEASEFKMGIWSVFKGCEPSWHALPVKATSYARE